MTLSKLQRYILRQAWESTKPKVNRRIFNDFYNAKKSAPRLPLRTKIITKSLERLIEKGLLIGYGTKTQHKLFITQVRLSPKGKKMTKKILGQQTTFPFSKKK